MSGISAQAPTVQVVHLRNEKASGTGGGATVARTWSKFTLNTEVVDTGGICSLSSDQFTLAAGTYEYMATAPLVAPGETQIRIYNATAAADVQLGAVTLLPTSDTSSSQQTVTFGRFTVAAGQALEFQYWVDSATATFGQGRASSSGKTEIYAQIFLRKVA